jgi:hypothetical protein
MIKWVIGLFLLWLVLDGCTSSKESRCVTFLTPPLRTITVKQDRVAGNIQWDSDGVSTEIDGVWYKSTIYSWATCTGGGK